MRAGPMHDRIRIDEPVPAEDGMLAPHEEWRPLLTCAASIATVSGREYFAGAREGASDSVRIVIRFPAENVTAACRCEDIARGIVYAINAVLFDDKRTLMTLVCESGANSG